MALLACAASATILRVQVQHVYTGHAVTLTGVASGDLLIAAESGATAPSSCSDGVNTWTTVTTTTSTGGAATGVMVAYAANVASGSTTVTCILVGDSGLTVAEYSGVASVSPVDAFAVSQNLGSGTTATFAAVSASSGDLVFAAGASESAGGQTGFVSPFTTVHSDASHADIQGEDIGVSAGSITPTATVAGAGHWCGITVAFKAASGGGTTMVPRHRASVCCEVQQ